MKVDVTYTIKVTYYFDDNEIAQECLEEESPQTFASNWIEEDFERVTGRAENVLPYPIETSINKEFYD